MRERERERDRESKRNQLPYFDMGLTNSIFDNMYKIWYLEKE
jgi:hypothetical protein